jgi:hypothetical protein
MKKNIFVFIYIIFILGCDYATDAIIKYNVSYHSLYDSISFRALNTIDKALWYSSSHNLVYISETGYIDDWKDPEKTIADGGGDCEDFCILFLNILFINTGIKGDIVLINESATSRNIVNGGNINHAAIMINGCIFDVVGERAYSEIESSKFDIGYIYAFDEIFIAAEQHL